MLDFDSFSAKARGLAAAIPAEFMAGIESVEVHRDAKGHPFLADVVTLGECATSPLSDPTGQEPFRSVVHLYYGSFADLAAKDPDFDVEEELRETIEHEVQHHLEDRAGLRDLVDEDAIFEAHARFRAGLEAPRGWYRQGEPLGDRLWAVDLDLFLELPLRRREWEALRGRTVTLNVLGSPLEFDLPQDAEPEEAFTLEGEGLAEEEDGGHAGEGDDGAGSVGPIGDLHLIPVVR